MPFKKAHLPARHSILVGELSSPVFLYQTTFSENLTKKINRNQPVAQVFTHYSDRVVIFRYIVFFVVSLYHIREVRL